MVVQGLRASTRVNTGSQTRRVDDMRSVLECLHQEMPPEMEVRTVGDELVQRFGVSPHTVGACYHVSPMTPRLTRDHCKTL